MNSQSQEVEEEMSSQRRDSDPPRIFDEKKELKMLGVCCGCARLSKSCEGAGLKSLGVDWQHCKDKAEWKTVWMDLASKHGMKELMN